MSACWSFQARWVPDLLEVPDHTKIDYVVTDLQGGPRPPSPVEDSYRTKTLAVSARVHVACIYVRQERRVGGVGYGS